MKQNLLSSSQLGLALGTFPSSVGGNHRDNRGWGSERIPHPCSSRRHISALTPPFYSGRALPSKWEDAERWICSPVTVAKSSQSQPLRRAKSKSGPIDVPPGIGYYQNCSPSMGILDGGIMRNFMVNSPFSTGVLMPHGVTATLHCRTGSGAGNGGQAHVERLASTVPGGWSELVSESESEFSSSQGADDENVEGTDDAVSRMATQMSPERWRSSSPPSVVEPEPEPEPEPGIREVQVDKRSATMIISHRRSRRHGFPTIKPDHADDDFNSNANAHSSSRGWDISIMSKLQREKVRIAAWEKLQKAKAEAAIRKLEMKLEKRRSSSMDKILNKLRMAEMKAEEMRSSISVQKQQQEPAVSKKSHKINLFRLSCFTCHVF